MRAIILNEGCGAGCQSAWRLARESPPSASAGPITNRPQVTNLPHNSQSGQATVEYAVTFAALIMPITFAIIFTAQLLWIWHSVVDFTREGARYATTHCWQGTGDNVIAYMRANVPPMIDMDQFQQGTAEISVEYFSRNVETGTLEPFVCEGGECSTACIPDTVTIRVRNYEFRRFLSYLGLPPVPLPDFHTSLPMESAGCDPDQSQCLP